MVTSGDFSRASLSFYDAGAAGCLVQYYCKLLTVLTKYTLNIHIYIYCRLFTSECLGGKHFIGVAGRIIGLF